VFATERLDAGFHGTRWSKWPLIRGLVVLYETLVVGTRWLVRSANVQAQEDGVELGKGSIVIMLTLTLAAGIGIFFLLPLLYQPLIDLQGGTNFVNHLTTNWTVSPDSRKFTFDLLPGVRFSNGREATAQDYAFALERGVLVDDFFQTYALQVKGAPEFLAARTAEADQLKTNSSAGQGRWIEPTSIAGLSTPSAECR
jgi:ABC-type transport system substrate-binding protein